jgi:hypothetical protein
LKTILISFFVIFLGINSFAGTGINGFHPRAIEANITMNEAYEYFKYQKEDVLGNCRLIDVKKVSDGWDQGNHLSLEIGKDSRTFKYEFSSLIRFRQSKYSGGNFVKSYDGTYSLSNPQVPDGTVFNEIGFFSQRNFFLELQFPPKLGKMVWLVVRKVQIQRDAATQTRFLVPLNEELRCGPVPENFN